MTKSEYRTAYIKKRINLSNEEVDQRSMDIANLALSMPIWDKEFYHIFLSITDKKEINTEYFLNILNGKDKNICVPVMQKGYQLKHILLQDNSKIKIAGFGVPEPVGGIEIPEKDIDVVFVPLMVYDKQGNRIGYGKGFYDRFLAQTKKDCLFIGISLFEAEEIIPHEETDMQLDYCISPTRIYKFK